MTKDEFITAYCERSGVSWGELSQHQVALACACGEDGCQGWAMVANDERSIRAHRELYAPCGCGLATCVEPWEPGCGLGNCEHPAVVAGGDDA